METHLSELALKHMPSIFQKMNKNKTITRPNMNTFIFFKVKEDCDNVRIRQCKNNVTLDQHSCFTGPIFLFPFLKGPQSCPSQTHYILPRFPQIFLKKKVIKKPVPTPKFFCPHPPTKFAYFKNIFFPKIHFLPLKKGVKLDNSIRAAQACQVGRVLDTPALDSSPSSGRVLDTPALDSLIS